VLIAIDRGEGLDLNQAGRQLRVSTTDEGKVGGEEVGVGRLAGNVIAGGDGLAGGGQAFGVLHQGLSEVDAGCCHLIEERQGQKDRGLRDAVVDSNAAALLDELEQGGVTLV